MCKRKRSQSLQSELDAEHLKLTCCTRAPLTSTSPKLVDRPGHSFSNSFQIDELMCSDIMFEVLEGHYNSTVGDRLKFKNTFRPAVSEHWERLPCLYLSSERTLQLVLGFSWRSKLWQTQQGWQYSHAPNGFGLSKKECQEYKWYQILIFVLDLARDAFHSILTSFALPGNTWPMMRRPPIWSLSYPLECRKTKKMQCRKGRLFLTRRQGSVKKLESIWWGVCPVLPTKRRGLQSGPDRDFGDLDHLNVRSNVIGCGVHGVHGVHQASLQCTSRSTESSRASWGMSESRQKISFSLFFPLDIFGSSPFKQDIGTNKTKGWRPTHPHKSHDCHLLQIGVNAKTTVQTVRTSEPLGIVLAGFCQDGDPDAS